MKILINIRNIKIIEKEKIYTGNVNTYIINVEYEDYNFFSEYNCYLTFKNNDLKKKVIIGPDLKVIIPFDVLSETGNLIIGFFAIKVDEKEKLIRYSSEIEVLPVEKGGFDEEASEPEELTPTILEKYLQEMKNFYNESLEEFNRNATNKTEEFNKNYEDKIKSYNDNSIQKTNEYNKNADEKIKEINNKVSDIEKIEDNLEQIQKNVQTSEQNAKDSEISAQNSAKKASESESNIISIEKNINDLKKDIDNTKTQIDEKAKEVKKNSDIAIEQARIATQQATLSGQNANKTSADKEDISQMKVSIEASEDNIEEIEKNVQAIKDDVETAKNETLEAKEDVENSLENERIISDKRYARAIDSEVIEIDNFGQVEVDQDGHMKDIEIESNLEVAQDVTETSPSLDYPSEFKNIKRELSIINNQENYFNTTQIANKSFSDGGLSISTDENGIFTVNGTNSEQVQINFNNLNFSVKQGQKLKLFKISGNISQSDNILNYIETLLWTEAYKTIALLNYNNNSVNYTDIINRVRIRFLVPSGIASVTYTNFKFGIMVVDDESIENYVPYNGYSEKVTLPENNFLGAFNGYKNYIKDNKLKSNLKIVEFTETLDWTYHEPENKFMCSIPSNAKIKDISLPQLCSHYKTKSDFASNENEFACTVSGFRFHNDNNMTLEEWKAFLAQQKQSGTPLQILYISNEEETELEEINLQLYQGINNISLEDLKLNFKYNISIEKYIEKNNENERKISDSKYARALKTKLEDVEQTQIYAENDKVENLTIKGAELTQKTREGYNQLKNTGVSRNHNGIDFTVNSDGTVLANGTATGGTSGSSISQINIHDEEIQFEAGDYTIQDCKAYVVYEDDSYEWFDGLTKATSKTFDKSFKTTDVYIQVNPEITVNNKLYYPMILKGTENKPYEEYGASPSLDYPSEIQVAKEQNISIEGKNKYRGWMNTTSTAVYGSAFLIKADLKPNTKYTISFLTPTFEAEYYRAEELTSNWFTVINNGKRQSYTFTTKADISNAYKEYNGEYGYILFKNAIATPSPANFSDVMLVEGDTDVLYEPYYGHDVNIPLTNSSISNYFDVIDRENKVQDKVIQELILTGNENYNFNNVENGIYQYSITPAKKPIYINDSIIRAMSNYFKGVGRDGSWNIDNSITTNMSNIRFMTSQYTTVEEFKAKIKELYEAGKPVKIYYVSETIDKIPLSEEIKQELNKFKLYDNLNNIFIDNGTLSFKYNKSLLRTLQEKDEQIDNLLTRVQALEQAQVSQVGGN